MVDAVRKIEETFTGQGTSDSAIVHRDFNVSISGINGDTIEVQRSFDDGSTWKTVEVFTVDEEKRGYETEAGVKYRLECTVWSAGTVICRISQ